MLSCFLAILTFGVICLSAAYLTYFYVGLICFVGGIFDIFCFGIITLNITLNNIYSLLRKHITIILQFNNITNKHHTAMMHRSFGRKD